MPSTCRRALVLLFSMAPAFAALTVRAQVPAPVSGAPPVSGAAPKPAAKPSAEAPPETPWPYVLKSGTTMITVFQPQLDVWDGFKLQVRAAVSVAEGEKGTPVYGIVHAETRTLVDKDRRTVHLEQYKLLKADFPSAPERAGAWLDTLQKDASTKRKTIALVYVAGGYAAFSWAITRARRTGMLLKLSD